MKLTTTTAFQLSLLFILTALASFSRAGDSFDDGIFDLQNLDGKNGFVIHGIDSSDKSGHSVSGAGDVNGDGINDIIIGAFSADPNGDFLAGESYVVFGGFNLGASGVFEAASLNGTNGFILNGIDSTDLSGSSVSRAGDVNRDGFSDILIGATGADPNGDQAAGESYVIFGRSNVGAGGVIELDSLDGTNGFTLNGIYEDDRSGNSVSDAGDVNGDGFGDFIIGAKGASLEGNDPTGASYVIFGSSEIGAGGVFELDSINGLNGFGLYGIDLADFAGQSVSSAGDVNGDGFSDLIVGADNAEPGGDDSAGESYVVFGGTGVGTNGVIELSSLNGTNGFVLNGINRHDYAGSSVSNAGDVNGDGFSDLFIGANGAGTGGEGYIVFGKANLGSNGRMNLDSLNGNNGFVLTGIARPEISSISISSAGDMNNDGFDDVIIGARYSVPNGNSLAGVSYLVFGGPNVGEGGVIRLDALDGSDGFVLNGISAGDLAGTSVSSLGDVNGDGIDDFIIGAIGVDVNNNFDAGASYVIFGVSNVVPEPSTALLITLAITLSQFRRACRMDNMNSYT